MNILLASSEAAPFAKSGGLADVATGLSKALASLGHQVTLMLPYHRHLVPKTIDVKPTQITIDVPLGSIKETSFELFESQLPGSKLRVILLDQPAYFDRLGMYTEKGTDYPDNCERFVAFSRGVLAAAEALELRADIVHANDWQTGLIPALLAAEYRQRPPFQQTASVFTIHNMAFQGRFWGMDMQLTGLDWKYFNWRQMEFHNGINLLKTGIVFADRVTTVSPTYAKEICTQGFGCELENSLIERGTALSGILNGVDTEDWNPATDPHLPARYTLEKLSLGKPVCKRTVQTQCRLPVRDDVPLLVMISRLTDQKGLDLIAASTEMLLAQDLQIIFLGTGEQQYEHLIQELTRSAPDKVAACLGFDEALAHRLEAGADLFLMPSRFEPCGLNQQYSQIYGTLPIVHATGGLADSVTDATVATLAQRKATGFVFHEYTAESFQGAVNRALQMYQNRGIWRQMIANAMTRDWSWNHSANGYLEVYQQALNDISASST